MAQGMQTWSTTAASNASADGAVNYAEGQAPSSLNDSARAAMASAAKWRDDNNGTLSTTGSSAAFTVTSNQGSTGNIDGQTIAVQFHATADSSATLSKDSNTAARIQLVAGTNLSGGELLAGTIHRFKYSSVSTAWLKTDHEAFLSSYIPAASVTGSQLADATINSTNLVDATIATTKISTGAVTYAKIQNVTASRLVANLSTSAGPLTEYSLGSEFVVSGSTIHTYGPKAWVTWTISGTTVTVQKSYNVTSVVRNTTGDYTITFTNSMTDAFYVPCGVTDSNGNAILHIKTAVAPTAAAITLLILAGATNNNVDPPIVSVAFFGN